MTVELPQAGTAPPAAIGRSEWLGLARRAKLLSWLSLAYMTAEGAIAITAGILAGVAGADRLRDRLGHRGVRRRW